MKDSSHRGGDRKEKEKVEKKRRPEGKGGDGNRQKRRGGKCERK